MAEYCRRPTGMLALLNTHQQRQTMYDRLKFVVRAAGLHGAGQRPAPQFGCLVLIGSILLLVQPLRSSADEPVRLREAFRAGYHYHVSSRVELSGTLQLPPMKDQPAPKPLTVTGESAIEYDEGVLAVTMGGQVEKTIRLYRRIDLERKVAGNPQQATVRRAVRRLVVLRRDQTEVPFSPDGPMTWGEIDLIRTDVFTPALTGLLSGEPVRRGDRWTATSSAIQELTDMEHIEEGRLECRLDEITTLASRRHARVTLTGSVRGVNEDGPNRQQLDGFIYFDLESNHVSYLYLKGVHTLLDKEGKPQGSVEGRFVLTRQIQPQVRELSDEALRGLVVEPNAENTLLLYENPDLGVRFLHPRRWRVGAVRGRQITLDETNGSGLLLTLEPPSRVPTGAQFLAESRDWLRQQKAQVLRAEAPRSVPSTPPGKLEHFALDVDMGGQRVLLDYYVAQQAQGGATLAARLLPTDQAALRKEVEGIGRSLAVTHPIESKNK